MRLRFSALALLALIVPLTGCGDDDDQEFAITGSVDAPVTAASAAAIVGDAFVFGTGGFFGAQFAGVPTTVTFTSATAATISGGGTTVSTTVTYGSCTFAGSGVAFASDPCDIRVSNGRVRLVLGTRISLPVPKTVTVTNNGNGTCTVHLGAIVVTSAAACSAATGGSNPVSGE